MADIKETGVPARPRSLSSHLGISKEKQVRHPHRSGASSDVTDGAISKGRSPLPATRFHIIILEKISKISDK